jgi:hypothetical protein
MDGAAMDVSEPGTAAGSQDRHEMAIVSSGGQGVDPGRPVAGNHDVSVHSGRRTTLESKLLSRIEKWAGDVGYWGQAANIVVAETNTTDYSIPLTAATFQLGSLSFRFDCVQDADGGNFRVSLRGSKVRHIADREALDRAIHEIQPSGQPPS